MGRFVHLMTVSDVPGNRAITFHAAALRFRRNGRRKHCHLNGASGRKSKEAIGRSARYHRYDHQEVDRSNQLAF
jgi:hypothetical protein